VDGTGSGSCLGLSISHIDTALPLGSVCCRNERLVRIQACNQVEYNAMSDTAASGKGEDCNGAKRQLLLNGTL